MKSKKGTFPWSILLVFVLLCALILSVLAIKKLSSPRISGYKLAQGWETTVRDNKKCVGIDIRYIGETSATLKEYLLNKGTASEYGLDHPYDPYNLDSATVFTQGISGVGNIDTVYVKSASNEVYAIEVNSVVPEEEIKTKDFAECPDFEPVVRQIVKSLL